jgi:C1A family cysteine protease
MSSLYGWFSLNKKYSVVSSTSDSKPLLKYKRKFGWLRDLPDIRDKYHLSFPLNSPLPSKVDLREDMPPVYDQGELGSCTANAIAGAIQYDELRQKLPSKTPSRLFIYYNERVMEDSVLFDAGAFIRDGIKSINSIGYCEESMWPYIIEKFTFKPSNDCYMYAANHKSVEYKRVSQNIHHIKSVLAQGYPVVFGFTVYSSFVSDEVEETGVVPMPSESDFIVGGHAVLCVGYNDDTEQVIFRNSWGESWGVEGYGYMPYKYIINPNLAADFWTVKKVE